MMNSAQIKIYNFTSGNSIPLTWGEIYALAEKHLFDNPLEVKHKRILCNNSSDNTMSFFPF